MAPRYRCGHSEAAPHRTWNQSDTEIRTHELYTRRVPIGAGPPRGPSATRQRCGSRRGGCRLRKSTTPTRSSHDQLSEANPQAQARTEHVPPKAECPATSGPVALGARLDYMASDSNVNPQHVMLKIPDLMARYGCGKTIACAKVNEPDFPGEVAPRRWRLDHVMACEEARAWAGRSRPASTTTPTETGPGDAVATIDSAARTTRSSKATV